MKLAERGRTLGTLASLLLAVAASACSARGGASADTKSASASGDVDSEARPADQKMETRGPRIPPEVCAGYDLNPDRRMLSVDDLTAHLKAVGLEIKGQRERENLHLLDVTSGGKTVRLRVATLPTTREAGRDLHVALLEHGNGFWGVHRSNLAVLATPGPDEPDEAFVKASKLPCWGVLTTAGRDDTFVVPGGYFEF
jgi:hypothetical protein